MADLFAGDEPTLQDMLGCARREVAMRESVYPRWVASGKLKQDKADLELRLMRGIVAHLEEAVLSERLEQRLRPDG
jgi:hypothetical protein